MKPVWTVVPRGDVPTAAAKLYVSMNPKGAISLNRTTYQRMGSPAAFLLLFDRVNSRIALKPTAAAMRNAYPARIFGRHGGRVVRALRLFVEFGIELPEIVEFRDTEIDQDGQLILDLRTAKVSRRAHSGSKRK
jgi:hypothetical protein